MSVDSHDTFIKLVNKNIKIIGYKQDTKMYLL